MGMDNEKYTKNITSTVFSKEIAVSLNYIFEKSFQLTNQFANIKLTNIRFLRSFFNSIWF